MSTDPKTIAILSYITIIGWVIALVMNNEKKSKLGSFHIRQSLLLILISVVVSWIPVVNWVIGIVLFIFWIMALMSAINKEEKKLPIIGDLAQDWFKSL